MSGYIEDFSDSDRLKDYTKKVSAKKEDGGDLNCPLREIAVACNPRPGKQDIIATGICTNDCILWHAGCPLLGGFPEDIFEKKE